jgi:hypothetical protein
VRLCYLCTCKVTPSFWAVGPWYTDWCDSPVMCRSSASPTQGIGASARLDVRQVVDLYLV